jgi:hypothetical protein
MDWGKLEQQDDIYVIANAHNAGDGRSRRRRCVELAMEGTDKKIAA